MYIYIYIMCVWLDFFRVADECAAQATAIVSKCLEEKYTFTFMQVDCGVFHFISTLHITLYVSHTRTYRVYIYTYHMSLIKRNDVVVYSHMNVHDFRHRLRSIALAQAEQVYEVLAPRAPRTLRWGTPTIPWFSHQKMMGCTLRESNMVSWDFPLRWRFLARTIIQLYLGDFPLPWLIARGYGYYSTWSPHFIMCKKHRFWPTHHQDFEAIIFGRGLIWRLQSGTVYLLPTCDQHVQFPGS